MKTLRFVIRNDPGRTHIYEAPGCEKEGPLEIYYSRSFVFIRGLIDLGGPEFVSQKTPFLRLGRQRENLALNRKIATTN